MSMNGGDAGGIGRRSNEPSPIAALRAVFRLKYQLIRFTVHRDLEALGTIPMGPWIAFGAAVAVAAAFGLFRLGIEMTYAESVVFLLLAPFVGLLGWTPGVVLVLLYVGFDLLVSLATVPTKTIPGRFVSYVILYALVVLIPSAQRTIFLKTAAMRRGRADDRRRWELVAGAVSAVVTAGLVYLWATVAPYLLRPMFAFRVGELPSGTTRALSVSRRAAVGTLQSQEFLLAVVAFIVTLAVAVGYQRLAGVVHVPHGLGTGTVLRGRFEWISRFLRYALVLVVLAGIITDMLDLALLAGALVASDLLLRVLVRVSVVRDLFLRIPWLVRLLSAFVLTIVVTLIVVEWRYQSLGGSEFFPFVLSLAIGMVVFRVFLDLDEATMQYRIAEFEREADEDHTTVGTVALVTVATWIFLATVPEVALADDCSGLSDCAKVAGAAISAAFAALAAAAWYMIKGVFSKVPPVFSQLEPLLSAEGAAAEYGGLKAIQKKVAFEYAQETDDPADYYRVQDMTMEEFAEFLDQHRHLRPASGISGFGVSGR